MEIQTYKNLDDWKEVSDLISDRVFTRKEVHKKGLLHLSAHLLIVDEQNICCRKRSEDDFRYAGLWTTTIGTHVLLGKDYELTIKGFLPASLKLNWVGEFRVHDQWENEVNGLFYTGCSAKDLPNEFLIGRSFITIEDLKQNIVEEKTTPHLKEALNLLYKKLNF